MEVPGAGLHPPAPPPRPLRLLLAGPEGGGGGRDETDPHLDGGHRQGGPHLLLALLERERAGRSSAQPVRPLHSAVRPDQPPPQSPTRGAGKAEHCRGLR